MSIVESSSVNLNSNGNIPEIVCIDYPANVVNVDNMIKTLGGSEMISKVYSETNRRLELRFRPDDVYCKPACGERTASTSLLIRVKRRIKKVKKGDATTSTSSTSGASNKANDSSSASASSDSASKDCDMTVHTTLLGVVNITYTFNTMCDAQYLPIQNNTEEGAREGDIPYSCITPQTLEMPSWLHKEPQFPFLPPAAFSRMDTPQFFFFRGDGSESFIKQDQNRANKSSASASASTEDGGPVGAAAGSAEATVTGSAAAGSRQQAAVSATVTSSSTIDCSSGAGTVQATSTTTTTTPTTPNVICRTRQRRTLFAIFRNYSEPTPAKPEPDALRQLQFKFLQRSISPVYDKLKKLFEERPIWSKNALKVVLGYGTDNLKYLLPTLGYYFSTGPWRNLWVRFGYDPRQKPKSFIYQTFDYRLKQTGLLKSIIEAKRSYSNYILPYKSSSTSKRKISVIQSDLLGIEKLSTSDCSDANASRQQSREPSGDSGATSADSSKKTVPKQKPDDEDDADLEDGDDDCSAGELFKEELYIFREGSIPPYRQMFYQYCDILVPEISNVLGDCVVSTNHSLRCDERFGWLTRDVEDECRRIVTKLIDEAVQKRESDEKKVK